MPRPSRCVLLLGLAFVLGACATGAPVDDSSRVAAVGRVEDLQTDHGYMIVAFPTGRANVSMDKREMGYYKIGDEVRIDSYGRPLPKR